MAVKKIKDIYKGYFQKSKAFLYPLLEVKKGSIIPIDAYMSWEEENVYLDEYRLICLFHLRDDDEFLRFEDRGLLNNPLFLDYKEVEGNKAAYIFDLSDYASEVDKLKAGKYSQFTDETKAKIRKYHGASSASYAFLDSYLYPENYFRDYAKFLTCTREDEEPMMEVLIEVGELCSKPDFVKEQLKIAVKTLDLNR